MSAMHYRHCTVGMAHDAWVAELPSVFRRWRPEIRRRETALPTARIKRHASLNLDPSRTPRNTRGSRHGHILKRYQDNG
jgi:hypothetical protein